MEAKEKSAGYKRFVQRYGVTDAYELEAMEPADLIGLLRSAVNSVIDVDLYNQELAAEETDSAQIIAIQEKARVFFKSMNLG
jgi:hypothetical protein